MVSNDALNNDSRVIQVYGTTVWVFKIFTGRKCLMIIDNEFYLFTPISTYFGHI